jgi:hypothetical protein
MRFYLDVWTPVSGIVSVVTRVVEPYYFGDLSIYFEGAGARNDAGHRVGASLKQLQASSAFEAASVSRRELSEASSQESAGARCAEPDPWLRG